MKFTKNFLIDSLDDEENTILDEITDNSRWSIHHRRVFKHDGKMYETFYSVGATEYQDEGPYEYDNAEIECREVVAVERVITMYVPKDTSQESST